MAKILNAEEIKTNMDIVQVINNYTEVNKHNKCVCPFHQDNKPSLSISPSKGLWRCFVCDIGGDSISFVREHDKLNYPQALEKVAKIMGVPIEYGEDKDTSLRLQTLNAFASFTNVKDGKGFMKAGSDFLQYLDDNFIDKSYAMKLNYHILNAVDVYPVTNKANGNFSQFVFAIPSTEINFGVKLQSNRVYHLFGGVDIYDKNILNYVNTFDEVIESNYKAYTSVKEKHSIAELEILLSNNAYIIIKKSKTITKEKMLELACTLSLFGIKGEFMIESSNGISVVNHKIPFMIYAVNKLMENGGGLPKLNNDYFNSFKNVFDRDEALEYYSNNN